MASYLQVWAQIGTCVARSITYLVSVITGDTERSEARVEQYVEIRTWNSWIIEVLVYILPLPSASISLLAFPRPQTRSVSL